MVSEKRFKQLYRWKNPYRICRKAGEVYGETPFSVYEKIGIETGLSAGQRFLELGSGRGRGLFYMAERFGCEAMGIEKIELFASITAQLALESALPVQVEQADYLTSLWPKAHTIYLYGTCLSDQQIETLCKRLVLRGDWIVTTSYSLSEYHEGFRVEKSFEGSFPWGKTELYCQRSQLYHLFK